MFDYINNVIDKVIRLWGLNNPCGSTLEKIKSEEALNTLERFREYLEIEKREKLSAEKLTLINKIMNVPEYKWLEVTKNSIKLEEKETGKQYLVMISEL